MAERLKNKYTIDVAEKISMVINQVHPTLDSVDLLVMCSRVMISLN
jgi:hypothetical protein